jgi:hypothetical protein
MASADETADRHGSFRAKRSIHVQKSVMRSSAKWAHQCHKAEGLHEKPSNLALGFRKGEADSEFPVAVVGLNVGTLEKGETACR